MCKEGKKKEEWKALKYGSNSDIESRRSGKTSACLFTYFLNVHADNCQQRKLIIFVPSPISLIKFKVGCSVSVQGRKFWDGGVIGNVSI